MSSAALDLHASLRRGDPLADAAVRALRTRDQSAPRGPNAPSAWSRVQDLARSDPDCARLVQSVQQRPTWVDEAMLQRGGTLFSRHALEVTSAFTLGSLVQTYMVPGIADLLGSTGLLMHQVQARLAGTGKFVLDVVTPGAFADHGPHSGLGLEAVMRVRLLHARVRAGASRARPPGAPVPINEAESLFTLWVHSTSILRGLARMGVGVDPAEAEAYQHLWRYVGYLMGLPAAALPGSVAAEGRSFDRLYRELVAPNDAGRALTHALLKAARFEPPLFLPESTLAQITRRLVGDEMADALQLPKVARMQAALAAMARTRRRVQRVGFPLPEALRRRTRAHGGGRLAPALGYRYYGWMVHRSARVSGRALAAGPRSA